MNIQNIHNPSQISVVVSIVSPILDQCRILVFPSTLFFVGERLVNHTIENINVIDRDTCEYRCYLNHNCVSVNFYFGSSEVGIQNSEQNNSTKKKHHKDLTKAANYVYHGTRVRIKYLLPIILIPPKLKWKFLHLLMHLSLSQCYYVGKLFPMTPPQHYYIFICLIKLDYLFIHHFISLCSEKTFSYLYFHAITYYLTLSFIFFIYLFCTYLYDAVHCIEIK